MNFQDPYRINQIDLSKIVYTKVKNLDKRRLIYIKYNDKNKQTPLVFQPPTLLHLYQPSKISDEYHEIEFPLITQESHKSGSLVDFFEQLDDKIIQDAKINSKIWFSGMVNNESIKYKRTIKDSEVHENGVIKLKIIKNVDFETLLQNESKKRIKINEIDSTAWCKMLLEVYAIIISQNGTFSLFIRPIILSFKAKEMTNYNYKFLEDSDDEAVPETEMNKLFMKDDKKDSNYELTSSALQVDSTNLVNLQNLVLSKNSNFSSSTSSDSLKKLSSDSNSSDSKDKSRLSSSSSESMHLSSSSDSSESNIMEHSRQLTNNL